MAYYAWLQRIYGNHNIHWPLASVFSDVCAVSARLLCLCCVYLCWFSFWFFLLKIVENNWKTQNVALWMLIWLNVCDARIFILEVYVNNMDVSWRAKFEYHSSLNSEKSTPYGFSKPDFPNIHPFWGGIHPYGDYILWMILLAGQQPLLLLNRWVCIGNDFMNLRIDWSEL